ncbi:hypothetical protein DENIS_2099 [Desulfonema ishimotonii]|uniref:Uncharacterized protein n=1 Tax=Desulfonema ishimotonii TaxID=45657 RepID=A0A401FW10_9BACT|nr:hypothetical protein [Desulfonema ishimotonii]GBC61139.1 hypothetical protein DENIS_2099 [Desulfonema ishimotonii]
MSQDTVKEDKDKKETSPEEQTEKEPVCTATTTAEHSRLEDEDEPCDDGRAGE